MTAPRERVLPALREAVLSGGSSPQMAKKVVYAHRECSLTELEALIIRYEKHAADAAEVAHLVRTFNPIAAEEMEALREEAIDIVYRETRAYEKGSRCVSGGLDLAGESRGESAPGPVFSKGDRRLSRGPWIS